MPKVAPRTSLPSDVKKGEVKKVLLLYSGGLKSAVALKWLQKYYKAKVVALIVDLGQTKHDMQAVASQAEKEGAYQVISYDAKEAFAQEFLTRAIKANVSYQGVHNLLQPFAITMLGKLAAEMARKEGIEGVAHGSSVRASDNLRFEGIMRTINPDIKIIAVARHIGTSRKDFIEFAEKENVQLPPNIESKYTYEENLWGVDIAGGKLDDPTVPPDYEDLLLLGNTREKAPNTPEIVHIEFENGLPIKLNGKEMDLVGILQELNTIGSVHAIGIEQSLHDEGLGLKFRAVMETPGASIILKAHKLLEQFVSTRAENEFKTLIDQKWTYIAYDGLWLEPLLKNLNAYLDESNKKVNGRVDLTLYKGTIDITGVHAPKSLFQDKVSLFSLPTDYNITSIPGYIDIYTLQMRLANQIKRNILLSIGKRTNKFKLLAECKKLSDAGYNIYATYKTHKFLKKYHIESIFVHKIFEKKLQPNLRELMYANRFDIMVVIPQENVLKGKDLTDNQEIHVLAKKSNIPVLDTVEDVKNFVKQI